MQEEVRAEGSPFLFSELAMGGPIEELEAVFEKRLRRSESLGEAASSDAYRRAFDLARARLESVLQRERTSGS
jgi:hypothetical protein